MSDMEILYTPWRMKYITSVRNKKEGCVFCAALNESPEHDRENYLVYRAKMAFAVMNLYPYNPGHLMILPYAHIATLSDIPFDVQVEMIALTSYFTELLSQLMRPDGFNIGLNIGRAAGAGIDDHLHMHIVPRWNGDSNFMPVIGETRLLPEELTDTYDKIVALLKKQSPQQFPLLQPSDF
jgi:ATP adenylyltransferase